MVDDKRALHLHIPLLGWTICNEDDQTIAEDYSCDNIIIEGAKNYM